ncbi:phytanoyl-CoA dioxygenase family protein [Salinisphaera sp. LB1]|uniref:phytanoyl-CoA dioxygenase family protein n=1 Tax=Salinisphaera sp. LB1 TaxID=2183911 RepID=UPI000D70527D|nr:phytanoyl-CoA dioxygenase family protein [Salinisphaera sp. LB1]AWN17846.1 Protein involved in biosynthesis of mitomycin antibiotics/polyketide fumonisin [Salinisphaera sp. LB1]
MLAHDKNQNATTHTTPASRVWLHADDCNLEDFVASLDCATRPEDYPLAERIEQNVPIYNGRHVDALPAEARADLQAELVEAMLEGPGIVVFSGAFDDYALGGATARFHEMIAEQRKAGVAGGDHFAKPGANDRVWRVQQKLAERDPAAYVDYYANPVIELISEAWLGPMYQVTSDLNVVNPGGDAQSAHRDYHLGFMSTEQAERFPAHIHRFASQLTLQGAVAHCDMPVESGPTLYLPYSQRYELGFLATGRPEFQRYFSEHHVQLPLAAGDAVFFNPALFHAAGSNRSADIRRMANLLQISSAFGRAMGSLDRARMCRAIYAELCRRERQGERDTVVRTAKATAEGYGFPTNLDRDQPTAGLAPETQCELLIRAVGEQLDADTFESQLAAQLDRRRVD